MARAHRNLAACIGTLGLVMLALSACGDGTDGAANVSTAPRAGAASPQAGASLPAPDGTQPPAPTGPTP